MWTAFARLFSPAVSVFPPEFVHPAFRIHDFLLPGVEGVAPGAYLYMQAFLRIGGMGLKAVAAAATYRDFVVRRMYIAFHDFGNLR